MSTVVHDLRFIFFFLLPSKSFRRNHSMSFRFSQVYFTSIHLLFQHPRGLFPSSPPVLLAAFSTVQVSGTIEFSDFYFIFIFPINPSIDCHRFLGSSRSNFLRQPLQASESITGSHILLRMLFSRIVNLLKIKCNTFLFCTLDTRDSKFAFHFLL